ncbi:Cytochrome c oxidase subunit 5A [Globodera pallida]|nr:Cytochrome c oxidase subunit 5A [Globodera pallida]
MYSLARKCAFNSATCKYVSKAFAHMSKQEIMWNWPAQKFDQHFLDYLNKPDIDGWELRKALTELANFDVVPDPKLVEAGLRACRRVNDLSLAVRFLEQIKYKSGGPVGRASVYPYIIQEVRPVLDELGIRTPEELGYDQPEFFTPEPEWYWEKSWYKLYGYTKMPGFKHFA